MDFEDREGFLQRLTVAELKKLAEKFRVRLEKESFWSGAQPATKKDDIVEILAESRIPDKAIRDAVGPKRMDFEELTDSMTVKQLRDFAKYDRISLVYEGGERATSKEDIIDIIQQDSSVTKLRKFLTKKPKAIVEKKRIRLAKPKEKVVVRRMAGRPTRRPAKPGMDELAREIEQWIPRARYKREGSYRVDLTSYLDHKLGYRIRQEKGEGFPDILVEGSIPIELKKNPTKPSYNRLFGQLVDFVRAYDGAIAVICDVTRGEQFEDFVYNVDEVLGDKVKVVKKMP